MRSFSPISVLLIYPKKYNQVAAFLTISLMWQFHLRSFEIFSSSNFMLVTTLISLLLMTIGSNWGLHFAKEIWSSLHFCFLIEYWVLSTEYWDWILRNRHWDVALGCPGHMDTFSFKYANVLFHFYDLVQEGVYIVFSENAIFLKTLFKVETSRNATFSSTCLCSQYLWMVTQGKGVWSE